MRAIVCTSDGFMVSDQRDSFSHGWGEIDVLIGFKEDRCTTDEISLDIFLIGGRSYRVSESMPGWESLLVCLHQQIPSVSADWDMAVMFPPFATNMTLLFDRRGRGMEEVVRACYPD